MEHLENGVQLKTGGCGKMSQPAMGLNGSKPACQGRYLNALSESPKALVNYDRKKQGFGEAGRAIIARPNRMAKASAQTLALKPGLRPVAD